MIVRTKTGPHTKTGLRTKTDLRGLAPVGRCDRLYELEADGVSRVDNRGARDRGCECRGERGSATVDEDRCALAE